MNNKKIKNRFKDVTAISFSNDEGLLVNFHGFYSERINTNLQSSYFVK